MKILVNKTDPFINRPQTKQAKTTTDNYNSIDEPTSETEVPQPDDGPMGDQGHGHEQQNTSPQPRTIHGPSKKGTRTLLTVGDKTAD